MKCTTISLLGNMRTVGSRVAGAAIGLLIVSSVPAEPIRHGSMTLSLEDPSGSWSLFTDTMAASGSFLSDPPLEYPATYLLGGGLIYDATIPMSWTSDSVDGWRGAMRLNDGVIYNLNGDANGSSRMLMDAAPMVIDGVGRYQEPFTFFADFCGFLSEPTFQCDATRRLVGNGTLTVVVEPYRYISGQLAIESMTWKFANAPEPPTLALFASSLVALGMSRRSRDVLVAAGLWLVGRRRLAGVH
jgi:hypothetical protein